MLWNAFPDPVQDGQRQFRRVLSTMAEPGTLQRVEGPLPPGEAAIGPALWSTLLALCDLDTRLWIAPDLEAGGLRDALAFHTGCRFTAVAAEADFALVTPATFAASAPAFAEGDDRYPDRSTTLLVVLDTLREGQAWHLSGPGIPDTRGLEVGEAAPLMTRLAANRSRFPCGLDAVLACGDRLTAIPRSTRIEGERLEEEDACMSQ